MKLDNNTMKWLIQVLNAAAIQSIQKLHGGVSSNMYHVCGLDLNSNKIEAVVRQIDNQEWLKEEPDLIHHEEAALKACKNYLPPTPSFIAADNASCCPFPTLLMTKLPGEIDLTPKNPQQWLSEMAASLSDLHKIKPENFTYTYNKYYDPCTIHVPGWSRHQKKWADLIHFAKNIPLPNGPFVFIHRDYHPNNILWTDGKITGIVDWINACIGPAGVDVGHCRWNLAMLYGVDAADDFLNIYIANSPYFTYDVYWDVISLLDVLTDPAEVYEGWNLFGPKTYTNSMMEDSMDAYMCSLWERMKHHNLI